MFIRPTQLTSQNLKCFLFVNCVGLTPMSSGAIVNWRSDKNHSFEVNGWKKT